MTGAPRLSIALPTYNREQVLIETIEKLLELRPEPDEILVLDQTEIHEPETSQALSAWHADRQIVWIRLSEPSQMKALNHALAFTSCEITLFLDDDILPDPDLISEHLAAHDKANLVAGAVMQPGEDMIALASGQKHIFNSNQSAWVSEFIGCNASEPKRKLS